ncbi:1,25-dihydroxyvitamin D(3) 24-hydroxylase, mitochondrial-like isoform X3 [Liolophura sinensis]|uniref:1,25-dihydroxyvitamin D(3) 24-hydroxylase, mitochondrial-like isoform X3 n=1 Tax=Liolophura sinensis TaxID=3198878 RepID=UPI003158D4E9
MTTMFTRSLSRGFPVDMGWMKLYGAPVDSLFRKLMTRKPQWTVVQKMSSSAATDVSTKPRPFTEIPGPKAYPFVGTMTGNMSDFTNIVPFFRKRCEKYFPLYKERMMGQDIVILIGAEGIEKFFRKEAKYPNRFSIPMWNDYREVSGEEYGIFTGQDEKWHRMRSVIDKPMLRMKDVKNYTDEINDVITDFLDRLQQVRGQDNIVPNLEEEFFNWSLEAVGTVLYERRFGGLSDHRDPEMERFIKAVADMFQLTAELFLTPLWLVKYLQRKKYKKQLEAWDILFKTAKSCVDKRMNEISISMEKGDEARGVLAYLLAQKSMSISEIYANVTELMMAAVDTTSSSMLWCLYEISQQPDVQDKLFAEVKSCVGETTTPGYEDLQHLPYMKAVIKETLRYIHAQCDNRAWWASYRSFDVLIRVTCLCAALSLYDMVVSSSRVYLQNH